MREVRFYTLPPTGIRYPYVLLNMHNWKNESRRIGLKDLKNDGFKHVLIDCAVDKWFFIERRKDYPKDFLENYAKQAKELSKKFEGCWITIPDYPDDYEHQLCWRDGKDNVDLTFENIERFSKIEGINWIFPLQSRFLDINSFRDACKRMKDYDPQIIGIGTVCKTNKINFIVKCVKIARKEFPHAWIHAFGPTLKAIKFIFPLINSFDSTAYFIKPNKDLEGPRMCKTMEERRRYFYWWIMKLNKILNKKTLFDYVD
jgi:hypothetical protein